MSQLPTQARLLQCFIKAIAEAEMSPREMRTAAKMLRSGDLLERAAKIVDLMAWPDSTSGASERDLGPRDARRGNQALLNTEVDLAMQLLKRRRVVKEELGSILRQIDSRAVPENMDEVSIRDALRQFRSSVSEDDWHLFINIISGDSEVDPFLRGILDR